MVRKAKKSKNNESSTKDTSKNVSTSIQGWGVDLDFKNRPAVPKERKPVFGTGAHWTKPEKQIEKVKIFKSTERPELTPVFGTSCPPKGLSGLMRTFAYKYSEGRIIHWMTLLLADRIDVIEHFFGDLIQGRPANLISEMGLMSEWTRHGIRSRIKHPKASTKRIFNQALLFGGIGAIIWTVRKYYNNLENSDKSSSFKNAA